MLYWPPGRPDWQMPAVQKGPTPSGVQLRAPRAFSGVLLLPALAPHHAPAVPCAGAGQGPSLSMCNCNQPRAALRCSQPHCWSSGYVSLLLWCSGLAHESFNAVPCSRRMKSKVQLSLLSMCVVGCCHQHQLHSLLPLATI